MCREIRSRHPEMAVLILTSYDDDEALFAAIMAGAAGYLLKRWAAPTSSTPFVEWRQASRFSTRQ